MFSSLEEVNARLRATGYIADPIATTTVYLAAQTPQAAAPGGPSRQRKDPIGVCSCGRRKYNG